MPRTNPWHSIESDRHHNNTKCTEGNNIEPKNRRSGTGNKPLGAAALARFVTQYPPATDGVPGASSVESGDRPAD